MKPKMQKSCLLFTTLSACPAILAMVFTHGAMAAAYTWDGGADPDDSWSADANWNPDSATDVATGDTLTFAGTTLLTPYNDISGLTLANTAGATAFTFASGAGAFVLSGNAVTVGLTTGGSVLVNNQSASNIEIQNTLVFAGNNKDLNIGFGSGAGTVTLSGNINFNSGIMGLGYTTATTSAGTLVLSGVNTGGGKTNQISSGGNSFRAINWTAVDNCRIVVGSDTALGNSTTGDVTLGTGVLNGILSSKTFYLSTANGDRNLSDNTIGITAGSVRFDGSDNLTIGNVINSGGNRDLWSTGTGKLTIASGLFLSNDANGRNLYFNVTGTGGAQVDGVIYDTLSNTGGTWATMTTQGTLRKAGAGTLTLNGNSAYKNLTKIEGGTIKLGHANALGSPASTDYTSIVAATLDLNGQTIAEKLWSDNASAVLANSSATAAAVTTDIGLSNNLTINTTGDVTVERLVASASRTVTKLGAGTLTTQGAGYNSLTAWDIQAGKVVFANTGGYGSDRSVTLNGGTLQLSGGNSNLVNDAEAFTINSGTFDLNGKGEAVASVNGSGGTITNSASSTTSTLYVGGGTGGTSSGTYSGVIEDGAGTMRVTKEGSGTQKLSGTNTYTGYTSVNGGTLQLGNSAALGSSATPATDFTTINAATLDLNGQTIAEKLWANNAASVLINSSATAASVTTDIGLSNNITINTTGDIATTRLIATATRTVTKSGAGTLTTLGTSHNNLTAWNIQAGTVVFANTTGYGADRGVTLNGGTLQLSGLNSNLVNDVEGFTINSGTFDLNGKGEAVPSLNGTGGTVTNTNATAADLYVGGGVAGTSTGSYAGAIQDGTGSISLTKEGTGTQTLTGTLAYSGGTTVGNGSLILGTANTANDTSTVTIASSGATLGLTFAGTDTVDKLFIGTTQQPVGNYGHTSSGATNGGLGVGALDAIFTAGTGILTVTSGPAAGGYSAWQTANGTSQTIDQDHDNDGVSNGVEYFLGGSTDTTGFTPLPTVTDNAGTLSVTWTKSAGYPGAYNTGFTVETSDTLTGSWTTETVGGNVTITENDVKYTFPAPLGARRFVRLSVRN